MRVLISHRPGGAYGFISDGWINAMINRGHQCSRWNGVSESWDSFNPQLYIGSSGHKQPIPADRKGCKLALHVNPYGPVQIPNVSESRTNIDWVLRQRPDAVFGYGHENDRLLWSYWTEREGIKWVPMPTAGDATLYHDGYAAEESKRYDLVYLGGRWAYKAQSIDKYLLPALSDNRMTYRVHGWGEWPAGVNSGTLDDRDVCQFLGSGRVVPCVSEPHTLQYGIDLPERIFKAVLCGTFILHDPVPDLHKYMPSAVVAQNPKNYLDLCHHYSRPGRQQERLEILRNQRQEVFDNHTYHHRMRTLLGVLGFRSESTGMVEEQQ